MCTHFIIYSIFLKATVAFLSVFIIEFSVQICRWLLIAHIMTSQVKKVTLTVVKDCFCISIVLDIRILMMDLLRNDCQQNTNTGYDP